MNDAVSIQRSPRYLGLAGACLVAASGCGSRQTETAALQATPLLGQQRPVATARAGAQGFELDVEEIRTRSERRHVELEGKFSGRFKRNDGTHGTYSVPIKLGYPRSSRDCNGFGLVDVVNSVLYETFETVGTGQALDAADLATLPSVYRRAADEPVDDSLFPFARLLLGDDFLWGAQRGGYVYAETQWNKLVIDRQNAAGTAPYRGQHIEFGRDAAFILRDVSLLLRDLRAQAVQGVPEVPCAVDDVIAFGHSQTGQLLRAWFTDGDNSALAQGFTAFDDGLVFEGSIQSTAGGSCRRFSDAEPYYEYEACEGATASTEGQVVAINSETDVQILLGHLARSNQDPLQAQYYRAYEIAGVSHIPDQDDTVKQNPADPSPVYRSLADKLRLWVSDPQTPPPQPAWLDGEPVQVEAPLFSENSWGNHTTTVFATRLGSDQNATGGVRLPHVITEIATVPPRQIGAPIGVHRGSDCSVSSLDPGYVSQCHSFDDRQIYQVNGGTFTSYEHLQPGYCDAIGGLTSIAASARRGAEQALQRGWLLPEDVDPIVERLVQFASETLECD